MPEKRQKLIVINEEFDDKSGNFIETSRSTVLADGENYYRSGDSYIHVDGGIVQNDTILPVFNTDTEDFDLSDPEDRARLRTLVEEIKQHPAARNQLAGYISRYEESLADFPEETGD